MRPQLRVVERCEKRPRRIEALADLPQQEIAVAPDANEPVRPQQQPAGEALDRLAEFELRARLALGREPPPRAVELVEGEADDLTLLGRLRSHGTQSNAECGMRN